VKLGVFISWSGERSRLLAREIAWWLPRVISGVRPWMSETDIHKGDRWAQQVGNQLSDHRIGIICVTPENTASPWLLFEAGALSKAVGNARVCPLLLGIRATEIEGPLTLFQTTVFDRAEMFALATSLNQELGEDRVEGQVLSDAFDKFWPELEIRVSAISKTPVSPQAVPLVIRTFAKFGFPEPQVGNAVYFSAGFESHGVYETACAIATKRLYVFGRKNRKLFDKEHADFFRGLRTKVAGNFDFRCLFLSPDAPTHVLSSAHQDADFSSQLRASIRSALDVMTNAGLEPDRHCRTYSIQRSTTEIIVDDAVLYTHIRVGPDGRATRLTKCPFAVINAHSSLGVELIGEFVDLWERGQSLRPLAV
jgi:TIR domain-containing protein